MEATDRCRRLRYWGHEYLRRGLVPKGLEIDIVRGQMGHSGLEKLLQGKGTKQAIEAARKVAVDYKVPKKTAEWLLELVTGMLWGLSIELPRFLRKYKILETEREERRELEPGLIFLARSDAILQNGGTDSKVLLSAKFIRAWDDRKADEHLVDTQGLSEAWAAEERLGGLIQKIQMLYVCCGKPKVLDVDIGVEEEVFVSPWWIGWQNAHGVWAHSQRWKSWDTGGWKALNSDWRPRRVAKHFEGGIETWVKKLYDKAIQVDAVNPLEAMIKIPEPIRRTAEEVEAWRVQAIARERSLPAPSDILLGAEELDKHFWQSRRSCIWPGKCPMYALCHGNSEYAAGELQLTPVGSGLFQWRVPNHPEE
jgi:hypothetical protein